MQIVIVGAGNVATVLGKKIRAAGHEVTQVLSRSSPQALAATLQAEAINRPHQITRNADLYLLAVNDSAIATVAASLPVLNGIIAHTAGALPLNALENTGKKYGVLYPLQSLRKEKDDYEDIPLLVDGNSAEVQSALLNFAQSISSKVSEADDAYRLKLHTAAVVVSNFTNHLYALAEDFCRTENADFNLLQPLIEEVALRMRHFSPSQMQTGPAVRGDEATIYRHMQLLENHPHLQRIYHLMTQSIQLTMNNEQ